MKVTIIGMSNIAGNVKFEGIDYETVKIKETHKRNGLVVTQIRIARNKRDIVVSSGVYQTITVQDEETGRYLYKSN